MGVPPVANNVQSLGNTSLMYYKMYRYIKAYIQVRVRGLMGKGNMGHRCRLDEGDHRCRGIRLYIVCVHIYTSQVMTFHEFKSAIDIAMQ